MLFFQVVAGSVYVRTIRFVFRIQNMPVSMIDTTLRFDAAAAA